MPEENNRIAQDFERAFLDGVPNAIQDLREIKHDDYKNIPAELKTNLLVLAKLKVKIFAKQKCQKTNSITAI